MEKKYALLIDAENADIKYLDNIFNELRSYGIVTYKRMYGDFTVDSMRKWNEKALEYAIVSIQQPHYSNYKNAADIMLVIDAMDILYANNVDGFCIVSNDSDYTRLVNRLREAGMEVIGMGSNQASRTLKAACTEYKILEKIFEEDLEEEDTAGGNDTQQEQAENKNDSIASSEEIKQAIFNMIVQNEKAGLGGIKSTLQRTYSDFDERNYGFTTIRKLIESMPEFQIIQENSSVYVVLRKQEYSENDVKEYIRQIVSKQGIDMATLGSRVHDKYQDFNFKNYGYNQFSKFVLSIENAEVKRKKNRCVVIINGKKGKTPEA